MASHLNDALKQFEAVEANVAKLERLWNEIEALLPNLFNSMVIEGVSDEEAYREKSWAFEHIASRLPKIDGFRLEVCIEDCEVMININLDLHELEEMSATASYYTHLRKQGKLLNEYRFKMNIKRRELARLSVSGYIDKIDSLVAELRPASESIDPSAEMPSQQWEDLSHAFRAIDALLGSSFSRHKKWPHLLRHLHFGQCRDFRNIANDEWPAVRSELRNSLYAQDDFIPVSVDDLGELTASNPKGEVVTELKWERLTPSDFERLLFNLISDSEGYENPSWLTHTNAPDDGRDLSVHRFYNDKLAGTKRHRGIIACKHWTSRKVDLNDLMLLREQMKLWEPPRVDFLVIALSGRFTTQAIRWVEEHNQRDSALSIEMWPGTHFERLLAQRPALIAEFGLR